jgi:hypothetical protein
MAWTKVWDAESNSYYYWDQETDETTWEEPEGFQEEGEATERPEDAEKSTEEGESKPTGSKEDEDFYKSQEYYNWYYQTYYPQQVAAQGGSTNASAPTDAEYKDYAVSGFFNSRTGKFKSATFDPRFNAEQYFEDATRSQRQMGVYFDVKKFEEQRGNKSKEDE